MAYLPNVHAVLFDLDETLIEPTCSFEEMVGQVYDSFSDQLDGVSRERFWKTYWHKAVDMWWMMKEGALEGDLARHYSFLNTLRYLGADLALAGEMEAMSAGTIAESTRLKENACLVLERLRKADITIGIVTNGYTTIQHRKIAHNGLNDFVDFVLASEEAKSHKPDSGIFHQALGLAGARAVETVFVGDTPDNDIAGARAVDMKAVLMDPEGRWDGGREDGNGSDPHFTIGALVELLPLMGLEPLESASTVL